MTKTALSLVILLIMLAMPLNTHAFTSPSQQLAMLINPTPQPSASQRLLPPQEKTLTHGAFVIQTFNNCGPAALSMTLSYFGMDISQDSIGKELRPYQNENGDNDDKSVTLEELANEAEKHGMIAYNRPYGSMTLLKQFIAYDIPVITRTWLNEEEDIGHYKVVKGYNDVTKQLVLDDSYIGEDLNVSYEAFDTLWRKYAYEYLVVVPKNKKAIAESIIGENVDEKRAWQNTVVYLEKELQKQPDDIYARFSLSVAYYHSGEYKKSAEAYEQVAHLLTPRTLWYQIEPIQAYAKLGDDENVMEMTETILSNQNRAFSELYILRGTIYKNQGDIQAARQEFEKAVMYNVHLEEAKKALSSTTH